jgi:hypothetical protein
MDIISLVRISNNGKHEMVSSHGSACHPSPAAKWTPSLAILAVGRLFWTELHILQQVADRQLHRQLAVDLAVAHSYQCEIGPLGTLING